MKLNALSLIFIFSHLASYAQSKLHPILEVPGKSEIYIIDENGTSVVATTVRSLFTILSK